MKSKIYRPVKHPGMILEDIESVLEFTFDIGE